ncbi:uncharacterized protein LOC108667826 isoform X2 [Hyalella azteca]|uniref:Uncharacterized protein LOC108667826 isoform X2 n=1 Tax=Hyalella azteca TaxID=294128 RepID=A0A979FKK7_HYAAZ|nr:uncharacterized protein LOC108667826 isoform X2 [Hyalella azteca]
MLVRYRSRKMALSEGNQGPFFAPSPVFRHYKNRSRFRVVRSTLLPSGPSTGNRRPRVDKLQTVEAKMASIEVSLGSRKRREVLLETLPRAARELVRELDVMQQALHDKDSAIQALKCQVTALGGNANFDPADVRIADSSSVVQLAPTLPTLLSASERKRIEERISSITKEIDSKRIAVKNLKLTLDNLDTTENIDVRIRAAEVEYELEREELNILNLREESTILEARLKEPSKYLPPPNVNSTLRAEESCSSLNSSQMSRSSFTSVPHSPQSTRHVACALHKTLNQGAVTSLKDLLQDPEIQGPVIPTLVSVRVLYNPSNPSFRISWRTHSPGCIVNWATDETRLKRGDRLLEVNGHMVLGASMQAVLQLIAAHAFMDIVVLRILAASSVSPSSGPDIQCSSSQRRAERQVEDRSRELRELQMKLDRALKEKETAKNDATRLTHRISYLEDQVAEFEAAAQHKSEGSQSYTSPSSVSSSPALCFSGATVIQVHQRGQHPLVATNSNSEISSSDDLCTDHPSMSPNDLSRPNVSFPGSSPRRTSSSSSSKSSTHNPSCDSSSSGYSSYPSLRTSAGLEVKPASSGKHSDEVEERDLTRPASNTEPRKSRRVTSPRPDSQITTDMHPASRTKPVPPKKPERLSLHRATSLLSVDQVIASSSRSLKRRGNEERMRSASAWKSIGDGLNGDYVETDCEVSSQVSGRVSVSSYRSDVIHKRRSRTHREYEVIRTSSTIKGDSSYRRRQSENFKSCIIPENSSSRREIISDISRPRGKDEKYPHLRDIWSSAAKTDFFKPSSDSGPHKNNSLTQTQSSDGSSCNTSRKSYDPEIDDNFNETVFSGSFIDDRSQSVTPTNSPTKFCALKIEKQCNGELQQCKAISEDSNRFAQHLKQTQPLLPSMLYKLEENVSPVINPKSQTLSSIHNQRNLTRDTNNRLKISPNDGRDGRELRPHKQRSSTSLNPIKAKENYPGDCYSSYVFDNYSSHHDLFSSLKRHTARSNKASSDHAPATPLTPRHSSVMKLAGAANDPGDWC